MCWKFACTCPITLEHNLDYKYVFKCQAETSRFFSAQIQVMCGSHDLPLSWAPATCIQGSKQNLCRRSLLLYPSLIASTGTGTTMFPGLRALTWDCRWTLVVLWYSGSMLVRCCWPRHNETCVENVNRVRRLWRVALDATINPGNINWWRIRQIPEMFGPDGIQACDCFFVKQKWKDKAVYLPGIWVVESWFDCPWSDSLLSCSVWVVTRITP